MFEIKDNELNEILVRACEGAYDNFRPERDGEDWVSYDLERADAMCAAFNKTQNAFAFWVKVK